MASHHTQDPQSNRLTFPQLLCLLGVYLAYTNGVSRYNDYRAVYDLTNRSTADWDPRIGETMYLCCRGFGREAKDIMDNPEWENLCSFLSAKFRGEFWRYDIYNQLTYLLDKLERISQCGTEIENVYYCPKQKPEREFFNTEINFLLVGQTLGISIPQGPPEAGCEINYDKLAGVLNRCSPFFGAPVDSQMVETYVDDLWMVLGTRRKPSVGKQKHLVANLKRPSHDDLSSHRCKKQRED